MAKIDEVDLGILRELQEDARKSLKEIAEKVGVAEGTVYNRMNKMKNLGIIKKFIPVLDYHTLGYDITAIIGITAEGGQIVEIEEEIAKEKNVTAVYDVTGDFDILVVAKFENREKLNEFVKKLLSMKSVKKTYTMLVLNVVKESHLIEL
ncbi:MAG: Lrp/AsnC ligand binding domain-containing protein [Archaeoglobaceae archaeon]|nr:Lrp/AsnC ligand binding domain-containing protein [Archaeoglobaceae archaeon]MDW7990109.1 Lrp/AsnC ligand binding domain-containing protein [Archaeoglobaceae archaeon]